MKIYKIIHRLVHVSHLSCNRKLNDQKHVGGLHASSNIFGVLLQHK